MLRAVFGNDNSDGFGGVVGLKRTCIHYVKKPVGWRCSEFAKASKVGKHPHCPSGKLKARDPRGRSPGLVRQRYCAPKRRK